jgi:hypothetical protein
VAGLLIDHGGPGRGFAGAFALMLVAGLTALGSQRWWRRADRAVVAPEPDAGAGTEAAA